MVSRPSPPFVFYDPSGKRWPRFCRSLQAATLVLGAAALLVLLSLLMWPQLPPVTLPTVAHLPAFAEVHSIIRGEVADENVPYGPGRARREAEITLAAFPASPGASASGPRPPLVFGYYVNWDRASLASLRLNADRLTYLVPEWLILRNANGDVEDETDPAVVRIAAAARLPVLAMVTNFRHGWQAEDLHRVLNDSEARGTLLDTIVALVEDHKFAGVNIDFEQLALRDRERLTEFMAELRRRLEPGGRLVTQSVPADDPAYDLERLAAINDYLVMMIYDEHYQSSPPGPVASAPWFERQLTRVARALPTDKTIIGVGNYGYDWIIGARGGAEVTFNDVMSAAVSNKATVEWHHPAKHPVLRYRAGDQRHEVWFLDAVTALNQVRATAALGFRGVAVWRLGAEDPGLWRVVSRAAWPDRGYDPSPLLRLAAQTSVKQYGEGEILRIVETPHEGRRAVWATPGGNFEEQYEQYPAYFVLESSGKASEKVIALTFDDGPDPRYTPRILDILKQAQVPATFFVVGQNAERAPALLKRIYAEGHEIGNHTYSHPNIASTSAEWTRLELNATQRIIQHTLGVSTVLFRPPYRADSEPQTPEEIEPVLRAQELGYITVGERIDPRDWEPGSTPDTVLQKIVSDKDLGRIVLLHDGGPRSVTVAALPRIIAYFRGEGYRFVRVGELIGKTREEVMPPFSVRDLRLAHIAGGAFDLKRTLRSLVELLFVATIGLTVLRSLTYSLLAVTQARRVRSRRFDRGFQPPVSVIIAAHNEEKVIVATADAILRSGYPDLEIIVVDDGSSDDTRAVLERAFGGTERVRVYSQVKTGKSAALNLAIARSEHEILVAVDADTVLRPGTIQQLVRHFADPRVGAVSGNARVGNRGSWITRFQSIEYICAFNLDRRALDLLNAITVVPGAIGAWRKGLILQLGGFGRDTLAEDTDLTLAIRRLGCRVRYEESAVAYTEVPDTTQGLAAQRFRWLFGTLQAVWKHRDALLRPKYGTLGLLALPSIWLFQLTWAALAPVADVALLVGVLAGNWPVVLSYYAAFFGLELGTALLAYGLEHERPSDLVLFFFQRVYYRHLLHYVLVKSALHAIRGQVVGWRKLEHRGLRGRAGGPLATPTSWAPDPVTDGSGIDARSPGRYVRQTSVRPR